MAGNNNQINRQKQTCTLTDNNVRLKNKNSKIIRNLNSYLLHYKILGRYL